MQTRFREFLFKAELLRIRIHYNTKLPLVVGFLPQVDLLRGGSVGGGAAVAANQVLYGVSPGVAGSEANFLYNATNTELTVTKAGGNWERIFLTNTTANNGALIRFTNPTTNVDLGIFGAPNDGWMVFRQNAVIGMAMAPTTRNIVIGSAAPADDGNKLQVSGSVSVSNDILNTVNNSSHGFYGGTTFSNSGGIAASGSSLPGAPNSVFIYRNGLTLTGRFTENGNFMLGVSSVGTDTGHRLDVASSGSAGTARFYDQGASLPTQVIIRAATNQLSTNLTTWQNSGGSNLAAMDGSGNMFSQRYYDATGTVFDLNSTALDVRSAYLLRFSSTTVSSGTKDTGLARNSAGIIEINNGTAGQFRDLALRNAFFSGAIITPTSTPASASAAGAAGTWAWDTNYIYICTATNTWKRVAIATW